MKHLVYLLALSANLAQGQYALKLNLEKGSTYYMKIVSSLQFTSEENGQKMSMNSTLSAFSGCKVVQVTDSSYELEVNYDSIHLTMKSPMGILDYQTNDSVQQGGMPMSRAHHPLKISILKNGAINSIGHPDSSGFAAMFKNFPMLEGIKKMMQMGHAKNGFNKQLMKENLEKMTAIFPDNKVALNQSWGATIHPDSNMANAVTNHYTLVDYQSGTATIKGHGESKMVKSQKQGLGMAGNSDIEGQSESTLRVNTTTGWVRQAEISSGLKGQLQLNDPSGKQGNKNITFELTIRTSVSGY
jgi:Family of unknown function (DUF6263)